MTWQYGGMSVEPTEPVTTRRRNPWKIATIVLAVLMGLGLVVTALGAAFAFGRDDGGYGTRNGRPCMGQQCMKQGKGSGWGQGGWGKGGMGRGGMGPGYGPVIVQQGGPAGPAGGRPACTKIVNPDGSVSVVCSVDQQGLPVPMPTAMPVPTGDVTPSVIWSGPVGDATSGVVVYSIAPADATPAPTSDVITVTVDQAPGAPAYKTCTFDGQTVTCTEEMGNQPAPMDQSQKCRTENGTTICWGTSYNQAPAPGNMANVYPMNSRGMMFGMAMFAGGLGLTFLTALAALILAILAFRRTRRPRPAVVTPAAAEPETPEPETPEPDTAAPETTDAVDD